MLISVAISALQWRLNLNQGDGNVGEYHDWLYMAYLLEDLRRNPESLKLYDSNKPRGILLQKVIQDYLEYLQQKVTNEKEANKLELS